MLILSFFLFLLHFSKKIFIFSILLLCQFINLIFLNSVSYLMSLNQLLKFFKFCLFFLQDCCCCIQALRGTCKAMNFALPFVVVHMHWRRRGIQILTARCPVRVPAPQTVGPAFFVAFPFCKLGLAVAFLFSFEFFHAFLGHTFVMFCFFNGK